MKSTTTKQVSSILRKNGVKVSNTIGSRIRGWGRFTELEEAIGEAWDEAHKSGRDLELRVLERHLEKMPMTINTDSIYGYIEEARKHIS